MNRQNFTENRFYQHENADSFKTGATDKHETHTFSHGSLNADCMPEEIISHFKTIEKAVIRLTEDTKTICELLNGIVNLKNKSEILSVIPQTSKENIEIKLSEKDVGEIDEENVKLFESKF